MAACAAAEIEKREADPAHGLGLVNRGFGFGSFGRGHGFGRGFGFGNFRGLGLRYRREANPEPEPEPEADPGFITPFFPGRFGHSFNTRFGFGHSIYK